VGPQPSRLGTSHAALGGRCGWIAASGAGRIARAPGRRTPTAPAVQERQRRLVLLDEASLLETKFAAPVRVAELQHRDGYEESLDLTIELPARYERSLEEVQRLLAGVPTFSCLTIEELQELARTARPITLGPMEGLIVQGQRGESLFVIAEGTLEVIVRRPDGRDWPIETLSIGAVVGEMSLLTGEPRAATVRATVYEIGRRQYEPLLRARPQLLDELSALVEQRLRAGSRRLSAYDVERDRRALRARIGYFLIRDRRAQALSSSP
jgi:CRP-like cAMP-binding protein